MAGEQRQVVQPPILSGRALGGSSARVPRPSVDLQQVAPGAGADRVPRSPPPSPCRRSLLRPGGLPQAPPRHAMIRDAPAGANPQPRRQLMVLAESSVNLTLAASGGSLQP